MNYSVFEVFRIGVGPSSSHTVGPMTAAGTFVDALKSRAMIERVDRVCATLYGSLALTGVGHATDFAVIAGLSGEVPEDVDPVLGRQRVDAVKRDQRLRLGGTRVNLLSQSMARRGFVAVIALRLIPVAPFAIVNMVAGATHLRLRHMLLGTALGMCPGTLAIALFTDQLMLSLKQPGPGSYALLALTAALITVGMWGLRRWVGEQQRGLDASDESGPHI